MRKMTKKKNKKKKNKKMNRSYKALLAPGTIALLASMPREEKTNLLAIETQTQQPTPPSMMKKKKRKKKKKMTKKMTKKKEAMMLLMGYMARGELMDIGPTTVALRGALVSP